MIRRSLVLIHRYAGLLMAPFLVVTGLTGAVISWDHELDEWLNPRLMHASGSGTPRPSLELIRDIERRDPRLRVSFAPLAPEPGESLQLGVEPRIDPGTGKPYVIGFNQIFVDPASGDELGRREWGAVWPVTRENAVSFLYKLHFSLHLPEVAGIDRWGIWLLGIIAMLWTIDCFTGVALTLPAPARRNPAPTYGATRRSWAARWLDAWRVRLRAGRYKLNYDLHRAGSLWTWMLLLTLAFTAFSLNLYREVFFPLMTTFSRVTPTPFDTRPPAPLSRPHEARLEFSEIVERARVEATRRGWPEPPGSIFYSSAFGVYSVQFFAPGNEHGAAGVGPPRLFFDGEDGRLIGERLPWQGTPADIFVQAQFPLHSGRILGLPGRILISAMGIVVAGLSLTGVYLWWRKRRASRLARLTRRNAGTMTRDFGN